MSEHSCRCICYISLSAFEFKNPNIRSISKFSSIQNSQNFSISLSLSGPKALPPSLQPDSPSFSSAQPAAHPPSLFGLRQPGRHFSFSRPSSRGPAQFCYLGRGAICFAPARSPFPGNSLLPRRLGPAWPASASSHRQVGSTRSSPTSGFLPRRSPARARLRVRNEPSKPSSSSKPPRRRLVLLRACRGRHRLRFPRAAPRRTACAVGSCPSGQI